MDADDQAVAPDGSPVLLYLVLPGADEAALVHSAIGPGDDILELGCGPGRVTRPLVALGHRVTGVDNSADMLVHLDGVPGVGVGKLPKDSTFAEKVARNERAYGQLRKIFDEEWESYATQRG